MKKIDIKTTSIEAELLSLHRKYFNAIFISSEDCERILTEYSAEDISYFGTGRDEHGHSALEWVGMNMRAIEQLPEGISYSEKDISCEIHGAIGIVEGELAVLFPLESTSLKMLTRVTTIYKQKNNHWQAIHFHASFPSSEQAEGESWPVEALKAKNSELEKIVEQRTAELKQSLENLKITQHQLIHAEKMASLGELTAGIAHEIQNPLNFVNNFSEANQELVEELQQANENGDHAEVRAIALDIKANEEKISHHGKRADSIVKGMLQHARASPGEKQPTDINRLVEEYLRLSFQGMRAKDKAFSVAIETHFDDSISVVNIVPQDIGRVLLNLFNNAFYAVQEKKAKLNGAFEPVVSVSTKREGEQVVITVRDNGTGMPQKVAEKVFQPFFTTKPTGEGTGLGLSLSYDIVTKGHGGNLTVTSKEGEGAEFLVQLPVAKIDYR
jgi:C4-dicarboxylate-specific signal transduction histidine kinase